MERHRFARQPGEVVRPEWLSRRTSDNVFIRYEAANLVEYEKYLMSREALRQEQYEPERQK